MLEGDGFTSERHIELFNSSEDILKVAVVCLKKLDVSKDRIKVDIYTENPNKNLIKKWSSVLNLPIDSIKLRKNTSPWKGRTEKLRLRVHSKELSIKLQKLSKKNDLNYVKGLFDAEGSVDIKGYVEFKQKAHEKGISLVNKIHGILNSHGIETTTPKIKCDGKFKKDAYFYVKDLENFGRLIGFEDTIKQKKLKIIIDAKNSKEKLNQKHLEKIKNKDIWEIVSETKCPYHTIRKAMME